MHSGLLLPTLARRCSYHICNYNAVIMARSTARRKVNFDFSLERRGSGPFGSGVEAGTPPGRGVADLAAERGDERRDRREPARVGDHRHGVAVGEVPHGVLDPGPSP